MRTKTKLPSGVIGPRIFLPSRKHCFVSSGVDDMKRALDEEEDNDLEVTVVVKADVVAAAIAATKSDVYDGIMEDSIAGWLLDIIGYLLTSTIYQAELMEVMFCGGKRPLKTSVKHL